MKFATSALSAFLLLATSPLVHSFGQTANTAAIGSRTTGTVNALFLSPEDLTNYMAKAHEEKIRAIKEVEDKKNVVIQSLKGEVKALKESIPKESAVVVATPPSSGMDLSSMSKEELRAKLVAYQQFMAEYIVRAQEQKQKAVIAAEMATAAKYEAKIKLLLGAAPSSSSDASTAVETAAAAASSATKLYDTRSSRVAAAAKAGKSRWGDKEASRAQINANTNAIAKESVNGAVEPAPAPVQLPGTTSLYSERNDKVAAAGKAGKSRWGDAEVQKARDEISKQPSLSSASAAASASASATTPAAAVAKPAPVASSTVIEKADHGLRNDGGVGGPSLAERVNLGQQLFTPGDSAAAGLTTEVIAAAAPSSYDKRNAKIAAAAAAGKSRWGSMENDKATALAAAAPKIISGAAAAAAAAKEIVSSPEIEAADHGLRNDGGVGGPSLAERVNLGLGIV
eukprot:jgi/Psemu1/252155/estExt_Genewise1Plus.C_410138